ncbi:sensor histidine kinase [Fibrella arboris]|uniref:sensor histidine kinase n=1 Tax=Fibrella arboris TaxID=3242486 RepID=UPI00351F813A
MMNRLTCFKPIRQGILVSLFLCLTAPGGWGQPCLRLDTLQPGNYLSDCLMTFTDSTGQLSVGQLKLDRFKPTGTDHPGFGTDGLVHWLTFTGQNGAEQARQFVLEVDIVYADEMSFYVLEGKTSLFQIEHDSWRIPLWQRTIASRYFAFPLNLAPEQAVRVFIRAQERSGTLITPIRIWERSAYERYYSTETNILILPAIILLFLTAIGLSLFITTRHSLWLFYAIYAFGTAVYNLNIEGVLAHYLPAPFNSIKGYSLGISLGYIGSLLFTRQYVYNRLQQPVRWLQKVSYGLIAMQTAWFLYVLVMPFRHGTADMVLLLTATTAAFLLVYLLVCLARGSYEARNYLLAIAPFLLIVFIRVLDRVGLLETQDWHYYLRYYAPLFEIIVLGVGAVGQLMREREATLLQLSNTQKEVIMSQEAERRRLAQDLHDDIGTSLVALRGRLPPANLAAHTLLDQIIADVRAVSHNLMPDELTNLGLPGAVSEAVRRFEHSSAIHFIAVCAGDVVVFTDAAELAIYRAVLELLHNVARHSGATEAIVQLVYHADLLNITVEDNGRGFDTQKPAASGGIGLKNVASRTDWLGGKMAIDSSAMGTTIRLDIPYS